MKSRKEKAENEKVEQDISVPEAAEEQEQQGQQLARGARNKGNFAVRLELPVGQVGPA